MTLPNRRSSFVLAVSLASFALFSFAEEACAQVSDEPAPEGESAGAVEPAADEPAAASASTTEVSAESGRATPESAPPVEGSKPKPPPYSLPFQLRPVVAASVVRLDSTLAFYNGPENTPLEGESGTTWVSLLLASYKVTDWFAPLVRLGVVNNSPPGDAEGSFNFLNPVVGGTVALKPTPELRLALFLGVTIPIGTGGGGSATDADLSIQRATNNAGAAARSMMDNAMFATSYLTVFPGVGFALIKSGFTAQVEATLLQLMRVKGEPFQRDASKTNFTAGLHVGYFFAKAFSFAVELRHQRWLSTPEQPAVEAQPELRDTTTIAFGPRVHLNLSDTVWFRPAVAFALPFDEPLTTTDHKLLQLDLPVAF